MDFVLLLFALAIGVACRIDGKTNDNHLSLDNTTKLRGILAFAIILHHMSEKITTGGKFFPLMVHAGYLIVAVFFFLSGYGCLLSYIKKGKTYLKTFWKNRILYLVIIYLLTTIAYLFYYRAIDKSIGINSILYSFINGNPIAMNSWYIIVQLFMYIFFYISYSIPNINKWSRIGMVFSFLLLLAILFDYCEYKSIWYISNFAFVFGLIYAQDKDYFQRLLERKWIFLLVFTLIVLAAFSALPLFFENDNVFSGAFSIRHVSRYISTVAFVSLIILFLFKIRIIGVFWKKMGLMSLELYLLHGMVYSFLHSSFCYIEQDVAWTLLTIAITVLISIPAHYINSIISQMIRKK